MNRTKPSVYIMSFLIGTLVITGISEVTNGVTGDTQEVDGKHYVGIYQEWFEYNPTPVTFKLEVDNARH
jgi:hypothetical protein